MHAKSSLPENDQTQLRNTTKKSQESKSSSSSARDRIHRRKNKKSPTVSTHTTKKQYVYCRRCQNFGSVKSIHLISSSRKVRKINTTTNHQSSYPSPPLNRRIALKLQTSSENKHKRKRLEHVGVIRWLCRWLDIEMLPPCKKRRCIFKCGFTPVKRGGANMWSS